MQALLAEFGTWAKLLIALVGVVVAMSWRPLEIASLAIGVFLFAYIGIGPFRVFVNDNPDFILTIATTVALAAIGVRLKGVGSALAVIATLVGTYIALHNLPASLQQLL